MRGPRTSRPRRGSCMARAARTTAALLLSIAVLVAATGWLYVLRPYDSLPGPRLGDALPLDELSHRGSAALVLYVAVWGAAAVLLALLARRAGAERLTAGLLLGPCVGAWLYLVNGLSILVVRQIPAHEAFQAAASEQAVAIPAILAGVAGAIIGRSRTTTRPRSRVVLSCLVAGVGILAAVNAVFPEHRRSLIVGARARPVERARRAACRRARRRGTQSRTRQSPCVGDRRRPAHPAALPERRAAVPRRSDRHRCGRRRSAGAPVRLRPPRRPRLEAANRPPRRRGRSGRARVRPRDAVGEPFDG